MTNDFDMKSSAGDWIWFRYMIIMLRYVWYEMYIMMCNISIYSNKRQVGRDDFAGDKKSYVVGGDTS